MSSKEVPSCGTLWGVAVKPPTPARWLKVESQVGRKFDFVYRYHDVSGTIPDRSEVTALSQGKTLHIGIAAREFGNTSSQITWAQVAQGDFDTNLRAQARGIAGMKKPVFVTFDQEANQKAKLSRGSGADFKAAWRHLHKIYQDEGATNAVWVWVMTGSPDNLDRATQLWPGNDVVDWISWNVYNQSGCPTGDITAAQYVSFEDKMKIFYTFVKTRGPAMGMDTSKPMMISETGSAQYPGDPAKTAAWYAAIPSVLQRYPQIKAVGLWDSIDGTCNYQFDSDPSIVGGVAAAGKQPYVNGGRSALSGG